MSQVLDLIGGADGTRTRDFPLRNQQLNLLIHQNFLSPPIPLIPHFGH